MFFNGIRRIWKRSCKDHAHVEGKGAKVSFDPNVRLEMLKEPEAMEVVKQVYREANIFMPGVSELKMITGEENLEKRKSKRCLMTIKIWNF